MTTCLSCADLGLKSSPAMAKSGFGHCKHDGTGVFKSISHSCDRHRPAAADIAATRAEWASKWERK